MEEKISEYLKNNKKRLIIYAIIGTLLLVGITTLFVNSTLCAYKECSAPELEGFNYCEEHKCIDSTCGNSRIENASCCSSHKCKIDDCTNTASDNGFCDKHSCNQCSSKSIDGEKYCEDHMDCFTSDCKNPKVEGGNYCLDHTCNSTGCTNDAISDPYCSSHECDFPACDLEGLYGSKYDEKHCANHGCAMSSCDNVQEFNSSYCHEHRNGNSSYDDSSYGDDDTCSICGGRRVCNYCGKSGMYCYNASFGTGQRHYCATHWSDIAEDSVYDEDLDIYWDYDLYDPESGYDYQLDYYGY